MAGTISKIISFENEELFIDEMDSILQAFTYLASRYGSGNVVEGIVLWDSIAIRDEEGVKVFRIGEFPYVEGTLNVDIETLRIMERYFDEMESKWDELRVEEINYFVEMLNKALGRDMVFYDAYALGLDRGQAYIIVNLRALQYLEHVVDAEDREIFEDAIAVLMRYI
ncbi:hypothetical protein [Thermococcus sp.]